VLNPILDSALAYERLGLCVIPMNQREKTPALKSWKRYQHERPSPEQVRRWFAEGDRNVGLVLGDVSSAVIVRDFDKLESYQQWASKFPELAGTLPTVQTSRGRHVYARADIEAARALCKSTILNLGDGELRAGGLVVAPPSIHPSGAVYRWVRPLKTLPPLVDITTAGFFPCNRETLLCNRENGENIETREDRSEREAREVRAERDDVDAEPTEIPKIQKTLSRQTFLSDFPDTQFDAEVLAEINLAVHETVPQGKGQRHRQVFELCRALKAIPAIADAQPLQLVHVLRMWWERAQVHSLSPWEEHLADFLEGWGRVKYAKGEGPMVTCLQRARENPLPEVAHQFEQQPLRLLVALCRELQRETGAGPFYLSSRTAGTLLGVDHTTAHRWLTFLKNLRILELTEKGSQNPKDRRANRYRYLLPL
jgi:hypothetical protein